MPDAVGPPARILLVAACSWESTVPLATALRDAGFEVSIVAPPHHPLHAVPRLSGRWRYRPLMPMTSLRRAIEAAGASIIMPCDEPSIVLLQRLRRDPAVSADIRAAIERALGPEEAAPLLSSRTGLPKIAERAGVRVPQSAEIGSARALLAWLKQYGAPAYLKIDRSNGGRGVVPVTATIGALFAYFRLRLLFGVPRTLWLWLRWGDLSSLPLLLAKGRAPITIQSAVDGVPANCALTAWQGNLLACVAVEALETRIPNGVATVIRVRDDALMDEAAKKIAAQLGLSGLHGLDFILAHDTGVPWLIEINGRPTQTAYLRLGARADLPGALYAAVTGRPLEPAGIFKPLEVITLFEQPSGDGPPVVESRAPAIASPAISSRALPPTAANSVVLSR
ncbi:MAG TPA: ATP-grasp domain-containing protein [Stellaceae bacterium]|jgi:hypothetical protein|nr:ATP-grasp domain-containing protein [Stellaceae bacterium]